MYEIIATIANLTALSVIGLIYLAYIKNLRSVVQLKDSQLRVAEQNVRLWKDKVLELERKAPEFIEKLLSDRIKIREDEISRLAKDSEAHAKQIEIKNKEIDALKLSLEKAHQYRKSISVWDKDENNFSQVPQSELEQIFIGSLCVDSATLMICDPAYIKMHPDWEEEYIAQKSMYKVVETGELFCTDFVDSNFDMELLGMDSDSTLERVLSMGILEKVDYSGALPAINTSYIKGDLYDPEYKPIRHLSFINGRLGAGISIALNGDGFYPVYIESYKGNIQRIIIDV